MSRRPGPGRTAERALADLHSGAKWARLLSPRRQLRQVDGFDRDEGLERALARARGGPPRSSAPEGESSLRESRSLGLGHPPVRIRTELRGDRDRRVESALDGGKIGMRVGGEEARPRQRDVAGAEPPAPTA